jgi:hypothetical protein
VPQDGGIKAALDQCWRWVKGDEVRARAIYWDHIESLMAADFRVGNADSPEGVAIRAGIAAFLYAMWQAFRQDRASGIERSMPGDVAEVSEEVLDEVYSFAVRNGVTDDEVDRLVERVLELSPASMPDDLGNPVEPDVLAWS